jgi:hypothetical protein
MNTKWLLLTTAVAGFYTLTGCAKSNAPSATGKATDAAGAIEAGWREDFNVNKANLMPTGANPYLSIQPGKR